MCLHYDTLYPSTELHSMVAVVEYSIISVQFVQEGLAKYQEIDISVILTEGSFEVNINSCNCVDIYHSAIIQSRMFKYYIVSSFILELWIIICRLLHRTPVLVSSVYCMCRLLCTLYPCSHFDTVHSVGNVDLYSIF
jgi:hypothetical protein